MRILLVGGGSREHALAWKMAGSPHVDALYAAPGNPGIAKHARCLDIGVDAHDALVAAAERERIDFVVVGPEAPLVAGLADRFAARGLTALGPSGGAAAIEGSKAFAKALMARHGIPTARFETFTDAAAARDFCRRLGAPLVVKADGLAAGKGVVVCATLAEADEAIATVMERRAFGAAGATVIVEECLEGDELSFFALVSDEQVRPLAAARDHKRVFDGDRGPNTGGMGAYSPVDDVDAATERRIMDEIVEPTVRALAREGVPYRGVLYAGLMLTADGPKVIEFNCRWGDPECQALMARADVDIVPLLLAAARGDTLPPVPEWGKRAAVCVAVASGGYPGDYRTGMRIEGLKEAESVEGVQVFHAGTAVREGALVTAGGRVLAVTAAAADLDMAIAHAYEAIGRVRFDGLHFRRDIGRGPLRRTG